MTLIKGIAGFCCSFAIGLFLIVFTENLDSYEVRVVVGTIGIVSLVTAFILYLYITFRCIIWLNQKFLKKAGTKSPALKRWIKKSVKTKGGILVGQTFPWPIGPNGIDEPIHLHGIYTTLNDETYPFFLKVTVRAQEKLPYSIDVYYDPQQPNLYFAEYTNQRKEYFYWAVLQPDSPQKESVSTYPNTDVLLCSSVEEYHAGSVISHFLLADPPENLVEQLQWLENLKKHNKKTMRQQVLISVFLILFGGGMIGVGILLLFHDLFCQFYFCFWNCFCWLWESYT